MLAVGILACQKPAQAPASSADLSLPSGTSAHAQDIHSAKSSVPSGSADTANLAGASPSPTSSLTAVTVHGEPIPVAHVEKLASLRGISTREALMTLIQATVVAQEAKRNAFPITSGATNLEIAAAYLTTLFSEQTLCESISQHELKGLYESAYKPDWPADIYQGDVVELRCCPGVGEACDSPQHAACFASLERHATQLETLAAQWRLHPEWPPQRVTGSESPYLATDFAFLDWPGIPDEQQIRKRLLDASTRITIKALKAGEVSKPIRSSLGAHVFRLNAVRKAVTAQSPEFQLEGRQYLCKKRIASTRQDYVKRLVQFVQVTPGTMELPQTEPSTAP